jgi:hypothetical protein
MRLFIKATPEEMAEIKASVVGAVERLKRSSWNTHKPKRGRHHVPDQPRPPGNADCRRYLQRKEVQDMVAGALKRGDGHFFVHFGQTLSKKFVFIEDTKYPLVPVMPFFLVDHWATRKDGLPEFCYLKPADMTQVCIEHLMDESLTEEAISKMRYRLKLKPFRHKLDAKVDAAGKLTFPQLDK